MHTKQNKRKLGSSYNKNSLWRHILSSTECLEILRVSNPNTKSPCCTTLFFTDSRRRNTWHKNFPPTRQARHGRCRQAGVGFGAGGDLGLSSDWKQARSWYSPTEVRLWSTCCFQENCLLTTDMFCRFEYKYSFKPPYLAQKDGTVPFFEYSGSESS